MDAFAVGIIAGLVVITLLAMAFSPYLIAILLNFLARNDIFFTRVEEGTAKAIMRSNKFKRFVMAYEGFRFSRPEETDASGKELDEWTLVQEKKVGSANRSLWENFFGGIRWLGIPGVDTVFSYQFRWSTVADYVPGDNAQGITHKVRHYEETLNYILLKDYVYYTKLENAETKEAMPVDIDILIPTRIMNPYKALFRAHRWLEQVLEVVKPHVRAWVSEKSYQEVREKPETVEREHDVFLKELSNYFEETFGARTKRLLFGDVIPPDVYVRISTKKYEAEREKERIVIEAQAEAERIATVTGAMRAAGEDGRFAIAANVLQQGFKDPASKVVLLGSTTSLVEDLIAAKKDPTKLMK